MLAGGIAGAGVAFFMWKKMSRGSVFVADHAKEALNFHLSMSIYAVASVLPVFLYIGVPQAGVCVVVLALCWTVLPVIAAIKARSGRLYRFPLAMRLIV